MSFERILAVDWEASGIHRDSDQIRDYDKGPQGIEIGAVVIDTESWTTIGDFTSRVQFVSGMDWDPAAERIHGISLTETMMAPRIDIVSDRFDNFLANFFDRDRPILLAGQCPGSDRWFTNQLFYLGANRIRFPWRFHVRMIDTFTLGYYRWGCLTGNELFERVCGVVRKRHSAYEDAQLCARVICEAFRVNNSSPEGYPAI